MRLREFCDQKRLVTEKYYSIEEHYTEKNKKKTKVGLEKLIKEDPNFLDSYLLLKDIMECEDKGSKADQLLDKAYSIALGLILDKNNKWPDRLEWDCQENRHIIRTFVIKGIYFWKNNEKEKALDIFLNLLHTDPSDDCGARYFILGIKEGLKYDEFNKRFNSEGFWDMEIDDWFF